MTVLEKWHLHTCPSHDCRVYRYLTGYVYGHPRANSDTDYLSDGHFVKTSNIVWLDIDGGVAITESGTTYHLGTERGGDNNSIR